MGCGAVHKCQCWTLKRLFSLPRCKTAYRYFAVDVNYFRVIFELSGGPVLKAITCIVASNKQDDWKQAENLCEGLRRATRDAVPG
jgi:hypothetical protein